jgi:predicted phosphodiesterase
MGLISDVHGNLVALQAVIADGQREGVDSWWVLGDLVAIGPDPVATLDALRGLPNVAFVRGNTDRYVVTGDRPFPHAEDVERDPSLRELFLAVDASFSWTRGAMSRDELDWLSELPPSQQIVLPDATTVLGIHASPGSDDGIGITPHIPERELDRLLDRADADVICGGHTHQPTDRTVGARRAVNLGSVSNPITDELGATYVRIDADRHGHRLAHRRVSYDHDSVIERIGRSGHPEASYIARFQRGEHVQHRADRPGAPTFS